MKLTVLTAICVLAVAAASPDAKAAPIISTFTTDVDGWTCNNPGELSHEAAGGNPGGYARFTEIEVPIGGALFAPPKFLGDLSAYDGETFSYDHKVFSTGSDVEDFRPYFIVIAGSGPIVGTFQGIPIPANVGVWTGSSPSGPTGWVPVGAQLGTGASGWTISPTTNWPLLLGDVTGIMITFEIVDNGGAGDRMERDGVDNVLLTPEPATLALLAVGACLLPLRRRRHS